MLLVGIWDVPWARHSVVRLCDSKPRLQCFSSECICTWAFTWAEPYHIIVDDISTGVFFWVFSWTHQIALSLAVSALVCSRSTLACQHYLDLLYLEWVASMSMHFWFCQKCICSFMFVLWFTMWLLPRPPWNASAAQVKQGVFLRNKRNAPATSCVVGVGKNMSKHFWAC